MAKAKEVHRTALSKIANQKGGSTTTEILDKLCQFFEVQIGEVAQHIEVDDEGANVHQ